MVDKEKFRKMNKDVTKIKLVWKKLKKLHRTRINNSQQIGNRL